MEIMSHETSKASDGLGRFDLPAAACTCCSTCSLKALVQLRPWQKHPCMALPTPCALVDGMHRAPWHCLHHCPPELLPSPCAPVRPLISPDRLDAYRVESTDRQLASAITSHFGRKVRSGRGRAGGREGGRGRKKGVGESSLLPTQRQLVFARATGSREALLVRSAGSTHGLSEEWNK